MLFTRRNENKKTPGEKLELKDIIFKLIMFLIVVLCAVTLFFRNQTVIERIQATNRARNQSQTTTNDAGLNTGQDTGLDDGQSKGKDAEPNAGSDTEQDGELTTDGTLLNSSTTESGNNTDVTTENSSGSNADNTTESSDENPTSENSSEVTSESSGENTTSENSGSYGVDGDSGGSGNDTDGAGDENGEEVVSERDRSLEFTLYDMDEKAVLFSEFRGKIVFLTFWSPWETTSLSQLSELAAVYQTEEFSDKAAVLTVYSVENISGMTEKTLEILTGTGLGVDNLFFDIKGKLSKSFFVDSYPVTYIFDSEGRIYDYKKGLFDKDRILRTIDNLN